MISFPYLRRKAVGLLHRGFSKLGRHSNASEVASTVSLLLPRRYAGSIVRIGGESDGAYVLPEIPLHGLHASISPGVSDEVEFDLELGQLGVHSYLYDASVSCPTELSEMQHFEQMFIDSFDSKQTKTLSRIVRDVSRKHPGDLLLQMDIEGAEYRCLHSTTVDDLKRFRIIILEFHALDAYVGNNLYRQFWINPILSKLRVNHDVFHVHANNNGLLVNVCDTPIPNLLEVTFLRRDFWPDHVSSFADPRTLDIANRTDLPGLTMPPPWF